MRNTVVRDFELVDPEAEFTARIFDPDYGVAQQFAVFRRNLRIKVRGPVLLYCNRLNTKVLTRTGERIADFRLHDTGADPARKPFQQFQIFLRKIAGADPLHCRGGHDAPGLMLTQQSRPVVSDCIEREDSSRSAVRPDPQHLLTGVAAFRQNRQSAGSPRPGHGRIRFILRRIPTDGGITAARTAFPAFAGAPFDMKRLLNGILKIVISLSVFHRHFIIVLQHFRRTGLKNFQIDCLGIAFVVDGDFIPAVQLSGTFFIFIELINVIFRRLQCENRLESRRQQISGSPEGDRNRRHIGARFICDMVTAVRQQLDIVGIQAQISLRVDDVKRNRPRLRLQIFGLVVVQARRYDITTGRRRTEITVPVIGRFHRNSRTPGWIDCPARMNILIPMSQSGSRLQNRHPFFRDIPFGRPVTANHEMSGRIRFEFRQFGEQALPISGPALFPALNIQSLDRHVRTD